MPGRAVSPQISEGVFDLARDGMTGPLGEMLDAGVPINPVNPASEAEAA